MPRKKIQYRHNNYYADEQRIVQGFNVHPVLLDGLKKIAKQEKRSVCWVVESALADYFGIEVLLRRTKTKPLPAYHARNERMNGR